MPPPVPLPPPPKGRWNIKKPAPKPPGPEPAPAPILPQDLDPELSFPPTEWPDDVPPPDVTDDDGLTSLERQQLRGVLAEFAAREMEALHVFEPMAEQERFFSSDADERVVLGGNRGGKTTCTCVEIARAVTGQDPHDKYPRRDGRAVLVGLDLGHCSKVFYRKLFLPGAYSIIRDRVTRKWRAYRPDDPEDIDRADESRPAPPLIAKRYYRDISWENKKEQQPKTVRFSTGWELTFYSSLGIPPQGIDVDLVAFDEEILHPRWYPEMAARLLDRRRKSRHGGRTKSGKFLWSATPQAGTEQLYSLVQRADDGDETAEAGSIEVFRLGMLTNEFIADHAKAAFIRKVAPTEEEYRVRVLGEFALMGTRVFGEFLPRGPHGCDSFPIPHDWTRYAALDPGRQVCAVLFAAVPPPGDPMAGQLVFYDELYIRRASALIAAEQVRAKLGDQAIHQWFIDQRSGRITEIGSGRTHEEQYRDAFRKAGVLAKGPGGRQPSGFIWSTASGSDDIRAGVESVRTYLHLDAEGRSRLLVFRDKLKNLLHEMELYSYKRLPSGLVTDQVIARTDHLVDCLRYICHARPKYHRPKAAKDPERGTAAILKRKKERARAREGGDDSIHLF